MLPVFFFLVSISVMVVVLSELGLITTIWDAALQCFHCTSHTIHVDVKFSRPHHRRGLYVLVKTGDVLKQLLSKSCTKVTLTTRALQQWLLMSSQIMTLEQKHAATRVMAPGLSTSYSIYSKVRTPLDIFRLLRCNFHPV